MAIELVLNDLSTNRIASNKYEAREKMCQLIKVILKARSLGVGKTLRSIHHISNIYLCENYSIFQWSIDSDVERELRTYFRSLESKSPILEGINDPEILDTTFLSQYYFEEKEAVGLGIAHALDNLGISFFSDNTWDASILVLKLVKVNPEDYDKYSTNEVSVHHASNVNHLNDHSTWFSVTLSDTIVDGTDLWNRRETLFPNLVFFPGIRRNICTLNPSSPLFKQTKKRLLKLDEYCQTWTSGPFQSQEIGFDISLESQATMQQFGEQRRFQAPDGNRHICEWHLKLNPLAWRLHINPDESNFKIMIGYIGPHLDTATSFT